MNEGSSELDIRESPSYINLDHDPISIISDLESLPTLTSHDFFDSSLRVIKLDVPSYEQSIVAKRLLELATEATTIDGDPKPILEQAQSYIEEINPEIKSDLLAELTVTYAKLGFIEDALKVKGMAYYGKSKVDLQLQIQKAAAGVDNAEEIKESNTHLRALPAELFSAAIAQKNNGHDDLAQKTTEKALASLKQYAAKKGNPTGNYPFYRYAVDACKDNPELLQIVFKQGLEQLMSDCINEDYGERQPESMYAREIEPVVQFAIEAGSFGLTDEAGEIKNIVRTYVAKSRDREENVDVYIKLLDQSIIAGLIKKGQFEEAQNQLDHYATHHDTKTESLRVEIAVQTENLDTALTRAQALKDIYEKTRIFMPIAEKVARQGDYAKAKMIVDQIYEGEPYELRRQQARLLIISGQAKDALREIKGMLLFRTFNAPFDASRLLSDAAVEEYKREQASQK